LAADKGVRRVTKSKKSKIKYGIAEWFGEDIVGMNAARREQIARIAIVRDKLPFNETDLGLENMPPCPFLSRILTDARCNKTSGVCSIRRYMADDEGTVVPVSDGFPATVCPTRFIDNLQDGRDVFAWVSSVMLGTDQPIIVKETPFLRTRKRDEGDEDTDDEKKAGRIDWIAIDGSTLDHDDPKWCAIETQAVYFSGKKMSHDYEGHRVSQNQLYMPVVSRRPDYRSSGPKRLLPQLEVKTPVLRSWGKKVAVVIDRYFYDQMLPMEDVHSRAKNDRERLDNAEIVWFVVDYDPMMRLVPLKVIYSKLEDVRRALNATDPISKPDFTRTLIKTIKDPGKTNKVFRLG
jgi:hypothetical protein